MADDLDVHELLEAPYSKQEAETKGKENGLADSSSKKKRSRSREKHRSRDRKRSRSRSRDRKRSRSRDRRRSRSRDRRRSRSRDRSRRRRSRSRSRDRRHRRRSRSPRRKSRGGVGGRLDLTPEERDARTVFCMQLSQRVTVRDLEEFFSSVGKVTDVRMIMCNKTRRFKGIVYVEFKDVDSVPLALGLSNQKLLGVPILVQPSQAEKNRAAAAASAQSAAKPDAKGSMRLYVGSLHYNITEDMLKGIFEPFGKIDDIQLIMDSQTGRSKGYGFLTFNKADDAKRALEKLNGFELAGRPMKVGHVAERSEVTASGPNLLDTDEMERAGVDLGATGRLQLMAKLAQGTGLELPAAAASALNPNQMGGITAQANITPPIATQCFMLSNMFDAQSMSQNPSLAADLRDDVLEECNKHGGVIHIYVDKESPQGNVYVKCPSIASAAASVTSLHGRWFAGKVITAAYVPIVNYHSLFPDAMAANQLQMPLRAGQRFV